MAEQYGDVPIHFNPIALRAAKTVWSFGRSESNRVKMGVVSLYGALNYADNADY